jgi:hypothetical protein
MLSETYKLFEALNERETVYGWITSLIYTQSENGIS